MYSEEKKNLAPESFVTNINISEFDSNTALQGCTGCSSKSNHNKKVGTLKLENRNTLHGALKMLLLELSFTSNSIAV